MAISLKHAFNSAKADGVDSTLIQPSNWNAEHTLLMASARLVGRTTAGTGAAQEITVGANLSLTGGSLNLASTVSVTALTASGALAGASVAATGAVTGASVAATGAVTGASVAATGDVSGATVTAPIIKTGAGLSLAIKNNANTETHATFTDNGSGALYYDNAKKIETDALGLTVTGRLVESDRAAEKWHVVTRSAGVYYQNTTGRMVRVAAYNESSVVSGTMSLSVNDTASSNVIARLTSPANGIGWRIPVYADVPPGHYYRIDVSGGCTLDTVQELS